MPMTANQIEGLAASAFARSSVNIRHFPEEFRQLVPAPDASDVQKAACYSLALRSTIGGFSDNWLAKTLDRALGADSRATREADARLALAAIVDRSYPWDGGHDWPGLDDRGRGIALTAWFIGQGIGEGLETSMICDDTDYVVVADKACVWLNEETDALTHLNRRDKDDFTGTLTALLYLARPDALDSESTKEFFVAASALATVQPEFAMVMPAISMLLDAARGFEGTVEDVPGQGLA